MHEIVQPRKFFIAARPPTNETEQILMFASRLLVVTKKVRFCVCFEGRGF
jgi:hypothetical protein